VPLLEIYSKAPEDPNYDPNRLEISDQLSTFIVQMENLLFTTPGEVLGVPNFGVGLNEVVFSLTANESSIREKILSQFRQYIPLLFSFFSVTVDVQYFETVEKRGVLVDIIVNDQRVLGMLF